jgi:hypothetical protein
MQQPDIVRYRQAIALLVQSSVGTANAASQAGMKWALTRHPGRVSQACTSLAWW